MELTKEQIKEIEKYLEDINFDYDDLKHEIIDHMASEIEDILEDKTLDFSSAFVLVRIKWSRNFRKVSSFYFGRLNSAPKIIINKAKKIYRPFYVGLLLSYFIPLILMSRLFNGVSLNSSFKYFLYLTSLMAISISFFVFYKIYISKKNTVYKFIIKTNIISSLLLFFILCFFFFLRIKSSLLIPFYTTSIYVCFVLYYLYYKHFKISKNNANNIKNAF